MRKNINIEKSRIRELRDTRGITQEVFADMLGVSQQTISRIEKAPRKIPTDLLISISEYFNVSVDYLLEMTDKKRTWEGEEKVRNTIDEYYDFISEYEELQEGNRKIFRLILRTLRDSQKI